MGKVEKKGNEIGRPEETVSARKYAFYLYAPFRNFDEVGVCESYEIHYDQDAEPRSVTFRNVLIKDTEFEIYQADYHEVVWIKKLRT